jgi:GNAT superfamily N-acetyltransferase
MIKRNEGSHPAVEYTVRNVLKPGDLGWVLTHHGIQYAKDQGYDFTFEKEIAESIASFVVQYMNGLAGIWIVEADSRIIGTIAVHSEGQYDAEIRWIIVLPDCQGRGIGSRLMSEAISFSRKSGKEILHCRNVAPDSPGIPLYERFGFSFESEECVMKWGKQWFSRHYILRL